MGLAGLVLIEDDEIRKLRLPKQWGIDDVPVIIQDNATPPMARLIINWIL